MARERAYMCYEIEVTMATYVTPCVQGFPSIRYYYSEWFISVSKLAWIGDRQRSHHSIKLSFWVSMILNILSVWHV
ncbi:hypothetical protein F383_00077 [Gossypium arboreum]|uniref:Uncharacterized protein n=1 Tax=Gossypium arboreum TaxID=29729 RepID=A0A0B0P4U2_GOSAR|nr:hypothetical protein F383_06057 [Gossypium arboreum]KHG26012.1 hypothetical protein F383_00077 [Gossypium arboreum]